LGTLKWWGVGAHGAHDSSDGFLLTIAARR
jgi:hypothetical protein